MFYVKGAPLPVSEVEVLEKLREDVFKKTGRELFHKIKPGPNNIQICCPKHKDGQEKNPSCGISTKQLGKNPAGTVHCFACGYVASLSEMISFCFGYDDGGSYGDSWLISNFLDYEVVQRKVDIEFTRKDNSSDKSFVSEEELCKYRYLHPYMLKRKLTDEIINMFDVGYDKDTDSLTFPVKDENGNCLFVARRSVNKHFFNYPKEAIKPLHGLYELSLLKDKPNELYLCESSLNMLSCWIYGHPAVALLGTSNSFQLHQLRLVPQRTIVFALDPDEAGEKACNKIYSYLKNYKICKKLILPQEKDVNDLTKEEFDKCCIIEMK